MGRKILYTFAGIISGFLIGALINHFFSFFPSWILMLIPSFIGGLFGTTAADRFNRPLVPIIISVIILLLYSLFIWPSLRRQQTELKNFIEQEKIKYELDRAEMIRVREEADKL